MRRHRKSSIPRHAVHPHPPPSARRPCGQGGHGFANLLRPPGRAGAFTLLELLVVIGVIALLASLLAPALARAGHRARQTQCLGNFRQIGIAFTLYLADHAEIFPDRRDLKVRLGFKPWTDWPPSDPRGGWAGAVLAPLLTPKSWQCAGRIQSIWPTLAAANQLSHPEDSLSSVHYWLWRFDRTEDPIPADNFWAKTVEAAAQQFIDARSGSVDAPSGPSEVELTVDAYFPGTVAAIPPAWRGLSPHPGGRNRLFLDGRAAFSKDARLRSR